MVFSEDAKWVVYSAPIWDYTFKKIALDRKNLNFGNAYKLLNESLSRRELMSHKGKIASPCIILITDGEPSQNDNYDLELDKLLENGWFEVSQRLAVLIGKEGVHKQIARNIASKFVHNQNESIIGLGDVVVTISSMMFPVDRHLEKPLFNYNED